MSFGRLFTYCIKQNKYQKHYIIFVSNQYRYQYNTHEFRKRNDMIRTGQCLVSPIKLMQEEEINALHCHNARIQKAWIETISFKDQEQFNLPDGSYCLSDIQEYFEYITKQQGILTDKSPVEVDVNKTKVKTGYYLELLTSKSIKLFGKHCMKNVQISIFFLLSIFLNLRIQSEFRKIRTRKNSIFRHFSRSEC